MLSVSSHPQKEVFPQHFPCVGVVVQKTCVALLDCYYDKDLHINKIELTRSVKQNHTVVIYYIQVDILLKQFEKILWPINDMSVIHCQEWICRFAEMSNAIKSTLSCNTARSAHLISAENMNLFPSPNLFSSAYAQQHGTPPITLKRGGSVL